MNSTIMPDTLVQIRQLLQLEMRQNEIARRLGVSAASVSRVAHSETPTTEDDSLVALWKQAKRCRGCGGLVYQWPCLTCRGRRMIGLNDQ